VANRLVVEIVEWDRDEVVATHDACFWEPVLWAELDL